MRSRSVKKSEVSQEECVHHWVIEPPTALVSTGVCQRCGAKKEFSNMFVSPNSPQAYEPKFPRNAY